MSDAKRPMTATAQRVLAAIRAEEAVQARRQGIRLVISNSTAG